LPGNLQTYQFPFDDFVETMNFHGIDVIAVIGNGYYRFLPEGLNIDDPDVYIARLVEASKEICATPQGTDKSLAARE
jgi:hypothetical protein